MYNEPFENAKKIIGGSTFLHYTNQFTESPKLTDEKKKDLNDKWQPLCREAISLLRSAYKLDPTNPDINAELVKILFTDFHRIHKIGPRSEQMLTVQTCFKGDDGETVLGYPAMMQYHAERCRQNDTACNYSDMLDRLLAPLQKS